MANVYGASIIGDVCKRKFLLIGILAASIITFVINLPAAVEWYKTGRTDTALIMSLQGEDEARYISRIREFDDGNLLMGNPFVRERRNDLPPGGFAEYAIAIPMHIFHGSLSQALSFSDIVFPFFILLLTYLWVYAGVRSTVLSIAFLSVFYLEINYGIVRESHPKITMIPFSLYLCLFFWYGRTGTALFLRGLLLGIMFYSYPYHWAYLLVVEALDAIDFLFSRPSYRIAIKQTFYVFGPFLLLAVPWIVLVRSVVDPAVTKQAYEHLGLIATRTPVAPWLQGIVACWVIATGSLILTKIRTDQPVRKIFLLLCSALVILNTNYITGFESEFLGHFGRVFTPVILFGVVLIVQTVCKKKWQYILSWCTIGLASIGIACITLVNIRDVTPAKNKIDAYQKIIEYIDRELPRNSVILAPNELNQILPALTTAYPFMSNATHFFFVPENELTDRYLASAAVFPDKQYPSGLKYVPVFGNNFGALWAKERTWHAILSVLGFVHDPFTSTYGDFAQDQELRKRIDTELAATDWKRTRETLELYELDYILSKNVLPVPIQDLFTKKTTIDQWMLYERKSPENVPADAPWNSYDRF
jgi:hypothetical protein